MKKILVLVLAAILFGGFSLKAQRKVDVNLGLAYSRAFSGEGFGRILQLQALYRITDNVKIGAGARLERLERPGYNTLPIFVVSEIRLPFLDRAFVFGDFGYSVGGSHLVPGIVADAGVGYFLPLGMNANNGFQFKIYYNSKSFKEVDVVNKWRSSMVVGIGYTF